MKKTILTILITAIITGAVVFISQYSIMEQAIKIANRDKGFLERQVDELKYNLSDQNLKDQMRRFTVSDKDTKDWNIFSGSAYSDSTEKYFFRYPKNYTVREAEDKTFKYEVLNDENEVVLGVDVKAMGCEGDTAQCASFAKFVESIIYLPFGKDGRGDSWKIGVRPEKTDPESKKMIDQIISTFVFEVEQ